MAQLGQHTCGITGKSEFGNRATQGCGSLGPAPHLVKRPL